MGSSQSTSAKRVRKILRDNSDSKSLGHHDWSCIMDNRQKCTILSKEIDRHVKETYSSRRNIFFADSDNYRHMCEIQRRFEKGELGVGPADTIYCLMCKASNEAKVRSMYAVKNRPPDKPISFWIQNLGKFSKNDFNPVLWEFMRNLYPAQVSIVLPKGNWLDEIFPSWRKSKVGNENSIAIRCPNSHMLVCLMEKVEPLAITSANYSGNIDVKDWLTTIKGVTKHDDITFVITDKDSEASLACTVENLNCEKIPITLEYIRVRYVRKEVVDSIWMNARKKYNVNDQHILHNRNRMEYWVKSRILVLNR